MDGREGKGGEARNKKIFGGQKQTHLPPGQQQMSEKAVWQERCQQGGETQKAVPMQMSRTDIAAAAQNHGITRHIIMGTYTQEKSHRGSAKEKYVRK